MRQPQGPPLLSPFRGEMVPPRRIELRTYGLRIRRSTN